MTSTIRNHVACWQLGAVKAEPSSLSVLTSDLGLTAKRMLHFRSGSSAEELRLTICVPICAVMRTSQLDLYHLLFSIYVTLLSSHRQLEALTRASVEPSQMDVSIHFPSIIQS